MAHNRFLARTVFVGEGGVNQALRALQRVLTDDKIIKDVQLKRNYEKPTVKRRRLKYESSLKLYNSEMKKKVEFLMSKQRKVSPWTWGIPASWLKAMIAVTFVILEWCKVPSLLSVMPTCEFKITLVSILFMTIVSFGTKSKYLWNRGIEGNPTLSVLFFSWRLLVISWAKRKTRDLLITCSKCSFDWHIQVKINGYVK